MPVAGLAVSWQAVVGAAGYFVEIENGSDTFALKSDVPVTATSFTFPPGSIQPNTDYVCDVVVIGVNGNHVISEVQFHTGS